MLEKLKTYFGIGPDSVDFDELEGALYSDVVKRNFYFHLFVIVYEVVMTVSISLRPGGPFAKPRRIAYFCMYLVIILATAGTMCLQNRRAKNRYRYYFCLENIYAVVFSLWGMGITLIDQLGGNGLTVYNYVILLTAIISVMKPWKSALLFFVNFLLLNLLLPYFPDPNGLDNTFNNLMNSAFLTLAAAAVSASLYNSKIQAKRDEIIIKKQYRQIEESNKLLSREALFDALTNLQNRNSFKKAVSSLKEMGCTSIACIYIDVNGLHEINNYLGHNAGDKMLRTAAGILLNNFSQEEVFRIGGDEFVILCRNMTHEAVLKRVDEVCRQMEGTDYSFSVGLEWRDSDLDVGEIVQMAETSMQNHKKEYYSAHGGERQKRTLNRQMERIISEKRDAERFLNVLTPVFKGVYFVDLELDTTRHLFILPQFKEMLEEADNSFSKAMNLYAHRLVKPEYIHLFEQFCDYGRLETMLDGEDIPGFSYERTDGERMNLRVLTYNHSYGSSKETIWIFSRNDDCMETLS